MQSWARMALVAGTSIFFGACFENKSDGHWMVDAGRPLAGNVAPTIAGSPPTNVLPGEPYEFAPSAQDADGDALVFSISRKPLWATFDRSTGRLSGTPDDADVGYFTNISITVSDGRASASLAAFDITVHQMGTGSATLSWNPPMENTDGSALTNLAGYRIYYGRNSDNLSQSIVLNNPGLTRYVVENLSTARWYFAMTSVNSAGTESRRTTTISKTIG